MEIRHRQAVTAQIRKGDVVVAVRIVRVVRAAKDDAELVDGFGEDLPLDLLRCAGDCCGQEAGPGGALTDVDNETDSVILKMKTK
jgi:hypothetical protein